MELPFSQVVHVLQTFSLLESEEPVRPTLGTAFQNSPGLATDQRTQQKKEINDFATRELSEEVVFTRKGQLN